MNVVTKKTGSAKSPKYLKISDLIKREIRDGKYRKGDRLPSCRDLSTMLGASYLTVTNAIKLLENEGVISCVQGSGNFVSGPQAPAREQALNVRTGFLMETKGDLYQNFFCETAREFERKGAYFVPLNNTLVGEGLLEEELIARIERYAALGIENLVVLGQRHFPYKYFNKAASRFEQIIYTIDYEAEAGCETPGANIIIPDFRKAGQIATAHLLDNGWKNISFITYEPLNEGLRRKYGASTHPSDMLVLDGMDEELRRRDKAECTTVINELPHENGLEAASKIRELLSAKKPAFVAMGDSRYRRVQEIADEMGLKAGRDFGFAGMYNTSWAQAWNLTSVSIREDELARLTVRAIVEKWKNRRIEVAPELVVRKS